MAKTKFPPGRPPLPWRCYRFRANLEDPRPISFPPPGPYWVTGTRADCSIVVAYLPHSEKLTDYWPEASEIEFTAELGIIYSDRFEKPEWFKDRQ